MQQNDEEFACRCGCRFPLTLGKYGCPNCCGDSGAARIVQVEKPPAGKSDPNSAKK